MQIRLDMVQDVVISADLLHEKVAAWAVRTGYRVIEQHLGRWVMRRGSAWQAGFTFDIRKVPSEVVVLHMPLSGQVACSVECGSWLQFETSGDRKTLQDEFDILRLMICPHEPRGLDRLVAEDWRQRRAPPSDASPDRITTSDNVGAIRSPPPAP